METEGEGVERNFKIEREPRSVEEEIKRLEGRRREQESEREGRDQVDKKKRSRNIPDCSQNSKPLNASWY